MQVGTGGVGAINAGAVRCNAVEVWGGSTLKLGIASDGGISANGNINTNGSVVGTLGLSTGSGITGAKLDISGFSNLNGGVIVSGGITGTGLISTSGNMSYGNILLGSNSSSSIVCGSGGITTTGSIGGNSTTVAGAVVGNTIQSSINPITVAYVGNATTLAANSATTYLSLNTLITNRGTSMLSGGGMTVPITGFYLIQGDWRYDPQCSEFIASDWRTQLYNATTSSIVVQNLGQKLNAVAQLIASNNYQFSIQNLSTTSRALRVGTNTNIFGLIPLA